MVLVGGHESNNGADLSFVPETLSHALITPPGRPLHNMLTRLRGQSRNDPVRNSAPIVVVPMTFGRNPTLVADTAKTLRWLGTQASSSGSPPASSPVSSPASSPVSSPASSPVSSPVPLALADPFGTTDHLTAWLRTAAVDVRRRAPQSAVLIVAQAANPFDDAELYRIAHLVRTHGAGNPVEAATVSGIDELVAAVQRMRLLGNAETVVVPGGFLRTAALHGDEVPFDEDGLAGASFYGPLLSGQATLRVIRERVRDALHALDHGDTGIDSGLAADHGHGYAHSHAFDDAHGHGHSHDAANGHTHSHPTPIHSS